MIKERSHRSISGDIALALKVSTNPLVSYQSSGVSMAHWRYLHRTNEGYAAYGAVGGEGLLRASRQESRAMSSGRLAIFVSVSRSLGKRIRKRFQILPPGTSLIAPFPTGFGRVSK
jgi:hypothetical protein